ncbi:MAG: hypothetical protein R3Y21_01595 [Mycoplasmatota bacterium]
MEKKKNTISFIIFSLVILFIVSLIGYFVYLYVNMDKSEYELLSGSITFTSDYEVYYAETDGIIKSKWDNNYYFSNSYESILLGSNPIVYNNNNGTLNIYGDAYKVYSDGSVSIISDETEIKDTSETTFYKLSDRVYLIAADSITSSVTNFQTSDYLLVVIDKNGNALLINHEVSFKVVEPITINTGDLIFNVATETIVFDNNTIDLQKINGSTNLYVEVEEEEDSTDSSSSDNYYSGTTGSTSSDTTSDSSESPSITLAKYASLTSIVEGSTSIQVNYSVVDPEGKYSMVYLDITGNIEGYDTTVRYQLSKEQTVYTIRDLLWNSEYTISFGYGEVIEGEEYFYTEDVLTVRTLDANINFEITKVTNNYIYFDFDCNEGFAIESGDLVLYIDGVEYEKVSIDIDSATSNNGWSSKISYETGLEYILKLENEIYNNNSINLNLYRKFMNY